jgi:hypothetical protein
MNERFLLGSRPSLDLSLERDRVRDPLEMLGEDERYRAP